MFSPIHWTMDMLAGFGVLEVPSGGGFQVLFILSKELNKTTKSNGKVLHLHEIGKIKIERQGRNCFHRASSCRVKETKTKNQNKNIEQNCTLVAQAGYH